MHTKMVLCNQSGIAYKNFNRTLRERIYLYTCIIIKISFPINSQGGMVLTEHTPVCNKKTNLQFYSRFYIAQLNHCYLAYIYIYIHYKIVFLKHDFNCGNTDYIDIFVVYKSLALSTKIELNPEYFMFTEPRTNSCT